MSAKSRIGWLTSSRIGGLTWLMSSRFGFGPMKDTSDITIASRIGSIGGLGACANNCLNYLYKGVSLFDITPGGESLHIEPVASSASTAIGAIRNFRSSWV